MTVYKFIFLICVLNCLEINGEDKACDTNFNCTGNAICVEGTCACDRISYAKEGTCLTFVIEYKGTCVEDNQCEWMGSNAECRESRCKCKIADIEDNDNYRWYRGKCQKYVGRGESCETDVDCYDEIDPLALKCEPTTKTCSCNDDYYDRGSDCRKTSKENGACAINNDCNPTGDSDLVCILGKCTKADSDSVSYGSFIEEHSEFNQETEIKKTLVQSGNTSCSRDFDCGYMANSICDSTTYTCRCKSDSYFSHEGNCLLGFNICDEEGSEDECAQSIPNTQCFKGICVCKPGYFHYGNSCIPEIGMIDPNLKNATTDCQIKPAKLQDSACYCKDYWFGDEANRECIKTTLQQTSSCLTNEWCTAMGLNSFCNASNLCQCSSFATFNETTFYCDGENDSPEYICSRDEHCGYNQRCLNESCTCIDNFSDINGVCSPDLDGSCNDLEACPNVENSICLGGICRCNTEFVQYDGRCLLVADNLNDDCEATVQCQNLTFSECQQKTHKCKCIEGFQEEDHQCWMSKGYGDPCMTSEQCTKVLNNYYECRNSKCVCPIGETLENNFCVTSSSRHILPSLTLLGILYFSAFAA